MSVILREIIPDGTKYGKLGAILPYWTGLEFSQDFLSSTAISFSYPKTAPQADKLKLGMYVVPVVNGNYQWLDSIFYIKARSGTLIEEDTLIQVSGYSLKKNLDKMYWAPAIGSVFSDEDMFRYTNITPGAVLRAGVENYLSRARNGFYDSTEWLSGVSVPADSKWDYKVDEIIQATTSISSVVSKYQDLGMATVRFDGFQLVTAHYDWYSNSPSFNKQNTVRFREGIDLLSGEFEESSEDVVTALLVVGAEDPFKKDDGVASNVIAWVTSPQAIIDKYGYHESILNVPDAANAVTLKAVGENYLKRVQEPRMSYSYKVTSDLYDPRTGDKLPTPAALSDYQCGDKVTVYTSDGSHEYTVYAITLSYDDPIRPSTVLTLNDSFATWQETFDQRLKILGG